MKRAIYIILLLLYTTLVHAYMYQSNMPTYQPQTKIGYTTNYSNGQFTPSAYQNFNTSTYSGTYNPYSNGNTNNEGSGRPGQPRRVHGYTGDGNYVGDNNGSESDFWEDGYEYYWDDIDKCWYRYNGSEWQRYTNTLGFLLGWHWAITSWGGRRPPSNPVTKGYEENPVPIGEPTTTLLILMFAYLSYHEIKKRRHCKHFFCIYKKKTEGFSLPSVLVN